MHAKRMDVVALRHSGDYLVEVARYHKTPTYRRLKKEHRAEEHLPLVLRTAGDLYLETKDHVSWQSIIVDESDVLLSYKED